MHRKPDGRLSAQVSAEPGRRIMRPCIPSASKSEPLRTSLHLPRSSHCPAGLQKSEGFSKRVLLGPRLAFSPAGSVYPNFRDLA